MNTKTESRLYELTVPAVIIGSAMALMLCASNIYLGLFAGQTVAGSIPGAVISIGLFAALRNVLKRQGSILENNIVQTMASSGYVMASGAIFTLPALVIAQSWTGYTDNYWKIFFMTMAGGILGVLFMIPIRRVLIVESAATLKYPEGAACAEVLKAGQTGGSGVKYLFTAMGLATLFKFFSGGYKLLMESVHWTSLSAGGRPFFFGADMSPALLAVGYVIGMNAAALVFIGGVISWIIGIPLIMMQQGFDLNADLVGQFFAVWKTKARYMGVGAMVVGGTWTLISMRKSIMDSLKQLLHRITKGDSHDVARTDTDMDIKHIAAIFAVVSLIVLGVFTYATGSFGTALLMTILMLSAAFFLVAVSSYICGLVGSSNSPVSGMTICAVLFTSAVMILFGFTGSAAILATLGVAAVVCSAACVGGDTSQDLKTGYLVEATPKAQQWVMILGCVLSAFIIAPVLQLLHAAYGIGTGEKGALGAPQATLFASLARAMFLKGEASLPWNMIGIGAGIGAALGICNEFLKRSQLKFRTHIMPVAVGIYLPFGLASTIFLGGLIAAIIAKLSKRGEVSEAEAATDNGVLFSSGLIAGEALCGIALAIPIVLVGKDKFPVEIFQNTTVSVLAFGALAYLLFAIGYKSVKQGK